MLTAPQLVAKLIRSLNTTGSFAALETQDKEHVLDAINAGIQEFYGLAPAQLKRTRLHGLILAPQEVTVTVTHGTAEFGGFVASEAQLYQTIVIDGVRCQIVEQSNLSFPWARATGSYLATLYSDSVVFGHEATVERVISHPRVNDSAELLPYDDMPDDTTSVGLPSRYREENWGQALGKRPHWSLRLWPLPDRGYRLSLLAQLTTYTLTVEDLEDADKYVPIENRFIEQFILPLCNFHLSDHRLWRAPENRPIVMQKYAVAKGSLQTLPSFGTVPANRVYTPRNF